MFILDMQTILKNKAENIVFAENGNVVSDELNRMYNELKILFIQIQKDEESVLDCIVACKNMAVFYSLSHELLQIVLSELFRDDFYVSIDKMEPFFKFLNKIFKIMLAFDLFKIQNPEAFSNYCESKLKDDEVFIKNVEESEDNKICALHMISLPIGRLFLSFFIAPSFELEHPAFIEKTTKIHLNSESTKMLAIFIYLGEREKYNYMTLYLMALFYKLADNDLLQITNIELLKHIKYLEMLKHHN